MAKNFEAFLVRSGLARNTVRSYMETVRLFHAKYGKLNEKNLYDYKLYLIENYKPKTVNLRIHALNKYLAYLKKAYRLKGVKDPQRVFLENIITNTEYEHLKQKLKADGYEQWYFIVHFLGATGARISELLQFKAEHVRAGHADLYTKGGKLRRIYFPVNLYQEAEMWLKETGIKSGYLFRNRHGRVISPRGVAIRLREFAVRYGINPSVVHPHAFRHLFAKNFLDHTNDIAFLADLLGHESIETTRIYLRRTSTEQQHDLDRIVTW